MTAEDLSWVPSDVDVSRPNPARVYDYLLGGANNFDVDRGLAKKLAQMLPDVAVHGHREPQLPAQRGELPRRVRRRQFLDLGSGIPTVGNSHEIAQAVDPSCRVVYVDSEAVAVAHSELILAENNQTRHRARRPDPAGFEVLERPEDHRAARFSTADGGDDVRGHPLHARQRPPGAS